jgi:hypothetical protein
MLLTPDRLFPRLVPGLLIENRLVDKHLAYSMFHRQSDEPLNSQLANWTFNAACVGQTSVGQIIFCLKSSRQNIPLSVKVFRCS